MMTDKSEKINFGLYIHVPFCMHLCNYCDFYKIQYDSDHDEWENYFKLLENHLEMAKRMHQIQSKRLNTIYLGGGTPSLMPLRYIKRLHTILVTHFPSRDVLNLDEFTLEADPNTFHEDQLKAWKDIGVNRVSVGVQAFDNRMLKIFDRKHTIEDVKNAFDLIAKHFDNYSADLLIGGPEDTVKFTFKRDIEKELNELLKFHPSHFSIYLLKVRKNYPHKLKADDEAALEYERVSDFLQMKGWMRYEISNFSKNAQVRSKHNMKYWELEEIMAIGTNATGFYRNESDHSYLRYQQKKSSGLPSKEVLTADQVLLEYVFLSLRTASGLH